MSRSRLLLGAVSLIIVTALATSGVLLYLLGGQITPGSALNKAKLFYVARIIQENYVENVASDKILEGAIKGMMNSLGDPHSIYMDPQMYSEFKIGTSGSFGGVGLTLGIKDKVLTVVAPIEGTPGEVAGIKTGDQIIKIDGEETAPMALDQAVNKIRGLEGTKVSLVIQRNKKVLPDMILVRSNIKIKSVGGKLLPEDIGYIRIAAFNESTGSDFNQQYLEEVKNGAKGIVLDLRGDPGGLVTESIKVASYFLPKGQKIVSIIDREGKEQTYNSLLPLDLPRLPVVVLVDGGSASASEIVAGAIQDTGAGTLVGTKTYGKGSVQIMKELWDGSAVKITIAKYYTPNGRSIHGVGLEPDVKLELPEYPVSDIQLEKAVEVLKTKLHTSI